MQSIKTLSVLFILGCSPLALAQANQLDCEPALLNAEKNRQETVYVQCGFDDETTAFDSWLPWAKENKATQAIYEIYKRYPQSWQAEELFNEVIVAKNGPALVEYATKLYEQKNYPEAITAYSQALSSPLLNTEEKGIVAQNIGLLYLNPKSSYHNPKKGLPLIQKATGQRSALANNIMGIYSLFGLEEIPVDERAAFFNLWRAALLDCPAAQENLGIYYQLYNKKISKQEAWEQMKDKIFTCQASSYQKQEEEGADNIQSSDCDCKKIEERMALIDQNEEYKFIFKEKDQNILENKSGQRFYVQKGTQLPDGNSVQEVRSNVVILANPKKVLYLMPKADCIQFCKNKTEKSKDQKTQITPYHFSFSQKECSDILYYADQLVDTKLPFVGKKECGYSDKLEIANNLLMGE